jgi:hypothetical protein
MPPLLGELTKNLQKEAGTSIVGLPTAQLLLGFFGLHIILVRVIEQVRTMRNHSRIFFDVYWYGLRGDSSYDRDQFR